MGLRNRNCNWQLAIYVMLSFAVGLGATLAGFILTFLYLLTTRHMHAAGPLPFYTYLVAPTIGLAIALAGSALALRHWRKARRNEPEEIPPHSTPGRWP